MRYVTTLAFMVLGFASVLLADNGYWPYWLWALILLFAPLVIFIATGRGAQYGSVEFLMVMVGGLIGLACFLIWLHLGKLVYPIDHGFWHYAFLFMFWGYAFLSCVKVGGTLMAIFTPERYNKDYLDELAKR